MLNSTKSIGVFDSGVGGLGILKELETLLPHEQFVFFADQAFVPYGEKTEQDLINRTMRIVQFFNNMDVKMVVVACNTATCCAIDELRSKFSFPFIGTVPAIKPAAQATKTGTVAILSTSATAKSQALRNLISRHASDIKVLCIGCNGLEDAVENGDLNSDKLKSLLSRYISGAVAARADCLVLGCTHYPFLSGLIQSFAGPDILLFDSEKAVAKQTITILQKLALENPNKVKKSSIFTTSGNLKKFSVVASSLLGRNIEATPIDLPF